MGNHTSWFLTKKLPSLKLTACLPLKMKRCFRWNVFVGIRPIFRGELLISRRVIYCYYLPSNTNITIRPWDCSWRCLRKTNIAKWFKCICWEADQTSTLHVGCQFFRWFPTVYLRWSIKWLNDLWRRLSWLKIPICYQFHSRWIVGFLSGVWVQRRGSG